MKESKTQIYDLAIIGGGVAGATAAYYSAKLGYKTILFEKKSGAHHKVCGEYLSAETVSSLENLGIHLDDFKAARIQRFNLFSNFHKASIDLDHEARGLSRYVLDEALLAQAEKAGATIKRGITIQGHSMIPAKKILIATGKHDQKNHKRNGENTFTGFKMHYQLDSFNKQILNSNVNVFLFKGGYAGLCFIENEIANLCLIIDQAVYKKHCHNYKDLLEYIRKQNKFLDKQLKDSNPLWDRPLSISNIPYGFIDNSRDHSIGDQYAVIPSIMGNGMAIANLTAETMVQNFHLQKNRGGADNSKAQAPSKSETAYIKTKIHLAYLVHQILKSIILANILTFIFSIFPWFMKFILLKTRIRVQEVSP
jgi:menaquinone-9 beta-reductase